MREEGIGEDLTTIRQTETGDAKPAEITNPERLAQISAGLKERMEKARREREQNIRRGVSDLEQIREQMRTNEQLLAEVNSTLTEYESFSQSHELDDGDQAEIKRLQETKTELEGVKQELDNRAQATFNKPGVYDRLRDNADLENAHIIEKEAMEKYGPAMDKIGGQIIALGSDMWKYENVIKLGWQRNIQETRRDLDKISWDTAKDKMGKGADEFARDIAILKTESITDYHRRLTNQKETLSGFGNRKKRAVIEALLADDGFDTARDSEVKVQDTSQEDGFNMAKATIYEQFKMTMEEAQKEYGPRLQINGQDSRLLDDLKMRIFSKLHEAGVAREHYAAGKIFNGLPAIEKNTAANQ